MMPLDDIGSVRVNVGCNDNGRAWMLFHQTENFRDCYGFMGLTP